MSKYTSRSLGWAKRLTPIHHRFMEMAEAAVYTWFQHSSARLAYWLSRAARADDKKRARGMLRFSLADYDAMVAEREAQQRPRR